MCCLCFGQFSVKNTLRQEGVFIENKSKGNVGDSRHFNKLNGECVPTFSELILQENQNKSLQLFQIEVSYQQVSRKVMEFNTSWTNTEW